MQNIFLNKGFHVLSLRVLCDNISYFVVGYFIKDEKLNTFYKMRNIARYLYPDIKPVK